MKRRKIPSNKIKAYNRGYTVGYAAAKRQTVYKLNKTGKGLEKVSKFGLGMKAEYTTAAQPDLPIDTRVLKWEGFTEAMNLIIASKR